MRLDRSDIFRTATLSLAMFICSTLAAQPDTGRVRPMDSMRLMPVPPLIILPSDTVYPMPAPAVDTSNSLLGGGEQKAEKVQNAFKTTKVVNLQSTEVTDAGVFDFKISHRFGPFNSGAYNAFGLDQAVIRIGGEYGIIPNLMMGIGRTSVDKTVDGYLKYRVMHQTSDNRKPLSILLFAGMGYRTIKFNYDITKVQRMVYSTQLIIGRKFNERFSALLSPSMVHYNIVEAGANNDIYALGIGMRYKVTNRMAVNFECIPAYKQNTGFYNSYSLGVDIETGGHVFQLHITNSTGMIEPQFIARNDNSLRSGGIRFGFNIARVFTFVDPSRFKNNTY